MEFLDPTLLDGDEVRAALTARDVGTVYRVLRRVGVSQPQIAQLTGQSQSEVCEILQGRQVQNVWVLERIANGLGIPRAWIGLSYGEQEPDPSSTEEGDEDVKRRALIAATSAAALGQACLDRGEAIEWALPPGVPLPSRLGMSEVHLVRMVTERLRGLVRYYGGQAEMFSAAARLYTRWMQVPAPEAVKAGLAAALAELHTEAGWAWYDAGRDATGYFTRALGWAEQAGDAYGIANTAWHAGLTLIRTGHPNDALKLFQLGQFRLRGLAPGRSTPAIAPADDPRLRTLTAWLRLNSATAYAVMNGPHEASRYLTQAQQGWTPREAFERGSWDLATAGIHLELGQLETAEQFAASALRTYSDSHRRHRIKAELLLAEVHLRAGEPQGLTLAHQAIKKVSTLQSIAVRRERLLPLATALEARPGTDTQQLAHIARQLATTQS
jgi:transcriptional regulator with XRE-family HTH domain